MKRGRAIGQVDSAMGCNVDAQSFVIMPVLCACNDRYKICCKQYHPRGSARDAGSDTLPNRGNHTM